MIAVVAGITCGLRTAIKNPAVSWNTRINPEPWEEYRKKQYKLYSPTVDYTTVESKAPMYWLPEKGK